MKKSKARVVFDKFKLKAERTDPRLAEHDNDVNREKLNRDAVKSLFILPEVERSEEGFEVV